MKNLLKQLAVISIFIAFCAGISAQNQNVSSNTAELPMPRSVYRKHIDANNYLAPILELKAREAEYLAAPAMRASYLETMTQLHALVGDYRAAYAFEEIFLGDLEPLIKFRAQHAKDITTSPLEDFKAISAFEAIKTAAGSHRIIIINEEHRVPAHRALTHRLLAALYAKGFRYFAAETLYESDADLNRRGYPVQKSGWYTADPVFGDVVRQALKLGFKVIPYEFIPEKCQPEPDNPMYCANLRETGQAQNLSDRIFKNDSKAKILVHAGRGHASKEPEKQGFAFMARRLWEISGIEPFTIDQEHYSERKNPIDERPLYRFSINKNLLLTEPTVFRSAEGKHFSDWEGYDLRVFTPRAQYAKSRPDWLTLGGAARKPQTLDLKKLKLPTQKGVFSGNAPVLIQAFFQGESADAIPIDQIIFYPEKETPVLMLPKGNFNIRAMDEAGKIIGNYKLTLK